jgi:hypothetical protein
MAYIVDRFSQGIFMKQLVPPHTLSLQQKSSAKGAMVLLDWPPPDHL